MRHNDFASKAFERTEEFVSDATDAVSDTIDDASDVVADQSHRLKKRVRSAAHRATSAMSDKADQLRDLDPRELMNEATAFGKRYPGVTLIAALTLGFVAGRALTRSRS